MATIDYEAEYDNRGLVPEHPAIFARNDRASSEYRAAATDAQLGLSYGPSARQIIDFFPAKETSAPLVMFIHGGYWRAREPASFSHMAPSLNARGVSVAVAGYDLCPQVTIATIIDQMRAACLFLWRKHKQRIMVFGHSAGGHLAACMIATDWTKLGAPADLVPAGTGISGVYDLTPLVPLTPNVDLKLDVAEATRVSPLFWQVPPGRSFDAIVGGVESGEFRWQSRVIADGWKRNATQTRYEEIPGANHFTVLDPMADANSAMVTRLVELASQVNAKAL